MSTTPDPEHQRKLDLLLSLLLDEGDDAAIRELNALLLDNPALQDEYIRYVSLHSLLEVEWNSLGTPFESLCASEATRLLPALRPAAEGSGVDLASRRSLAIGERTGRGVCRRRPLEGIFGALMLPRRALSPAAAAAFMVAALAAGAMGGVMMVYSLDRIWWSQAGASYTPEQIEAADRWIEAKRQEQGNLLGYFPAPNAGLWADVRINEDSHRFKHGRLIPGVVRLEEFNGGEGEGYLVALPPGHGIELLVDVESCKENALIVKRVTAEGVPTGHTLSFNNRDLETSSTSTRQVGRVGCWVDFNEYDQTRYYLLCGVNIGHSVSGDEKWAYSSFKPLSVRRDLMYLGWDDGDSIGSDQSPLETIEADEDYNDVSVILRIRRPVDIDPWSDAKIVASPERSSDDAITPVPPDSFMLRVEPRQSVLIHVSGAINNRHVLDIIDAANESRWWRYQGTGDGESFDIYSVDNRTNKPIDLAFVGRRLARASRINAARTEGLLVPNVYVKDDDYCEIGYDDLTATEKAVDTGDIRVRLHWIQ